jgi:hypothetical protein
MGLSSSKSNTTSNTTANSTSMPTPPSWLAQPYEDLASQAAGLLKNPAASYTTGSNPALNNAYAGAANLGSNPAIGQATDATRGLLNSNPITFNPIRANPIGARTINGVGPVSAGSINASPINVGMLKDVNLSDYMNPYTQSVIDAGVTDLNSARQRAIVGNSAASAAGGGNAWNGDRAGVADSETNKGFLDSVSSFVANQRQAGYQNAQQAALQDINNKFGADTFNSTQGVDVQKYNTDAAYRAAVDNATRELGTQQFNAGQLTGADQFNSNQAFDAQKFNSSGAYSAAADDFARKLGAAGNLFNFGTGADANTRSNLTTAGQLGESQRQVESENNPQVAQAKQMAMILAMLQGIPINAFTGQTTNSTGTAEGMTKDNPSFINSASTLMTGIGNLFGGAGKVFGT